MSASIDSADDTSMRRRVLCVVAHPDDEVLGLGGTLCRHVRAGGEVAVLILSEGEEAKVEAPRSDHRLQSAREAAAIMGTHEVSFLEFPDQKLDTVPFIDVIKPIEAAILRLRPQVVYTHHGGDANTDHQVAFKAAYAACRPMSHFGASVERLLAFETPSSTEQAPQMGPYLFGPTCFVDVEETWETKLRALRCYESEMIGGLHPRSYEYVEALARARNRKRST
jgi:LmbE family N-acetylglucosaminyl deacetylase